jgi:steroid 5-alpha reductase family enzyme
MLSTYFISLCILVIYATVLFGVSIYKKDNSLMDIAYGPAFITVTLFYMVSTLLANNISHYIIIACTLVIVWGTRLAYRIYNKNHGKPEDFRYAAWRTAWSKHGTGYFLLRSYLQIYLLQAFIVSLVLLPITALFVYSATVVSILYFVGCALWCVGFWFEATGDSELDAFIKSTNPKKGTIMKSGLWAYTRHPNYFGESLMWWSLALIAWSITSSFVVFISPLVITFLLLFVSGVPMLEKRWEGNKEWETYKKKTSVFFPLPPRSC